MKKQDNQKTREYKNYIAPQRPGSPSPKGCIAPITETIPRLWRQGQTAETVVVQHIINRKAKKCCRPEYLPMLRKRDHPTGKTQGCIP